MDSDCTGGHMAMQFDTASQNNLMNWLKYEESNVGFRNAPRGY